MKKSYNKAFTLVELLAVIVILAIILVIAVPKIMDVINSSKKSTLETSVKMIASTAEKTKMQNTVLGKENEEITCDSVAKLSSSDYDLSTCKITFTNSIAKVTVKGKGKFEGLNICGGTKNSATAQEEECPSPFESDSWPTIIAAVQSGEYPYKVGETKEVDLGTTLGTHTLRIANTKSCEGLNLSSQTACGLVLEFADIITEHNMNSLDTNVGGWPASAMRKYVNDTIYNSLPSELKNAIIDTTVVSGHGYDDTTGTLANNNFESTDKLYLLSPEEVWSDWNHLNDTSIGTSRQLDYYKAQNVSTSSYSGAKKLNGSSEIWWWLRSAFNENAPGFFAVYENGKRCFYDQYNNGNGVSPAFRIAE